ncbi:MAG: LysM peptidoglycan-binding domain-containing protein [Terrimicrobiaceae bacterium]|nr:LysM peptidoglycan-binding domain-containing protein [Terrimicrobiaceae bacterium]
MKPIPRPPTPRRVPRRMVKTLRARASASEKDFEEYGEEPEPNMKFSHALVVVLVLHILAVGGVFAFNSLKGRQLAPNRAKPAASGASASTPDVVTTPANKSALPAALPGATNKAATAGRTETGGTTYSVVAGDTLTRIATAQKTTVEALEQANGIGSNSAIRVGQVLEIPGVVPVRQETPAAKASGIKPAPVAKSPEVKPPAAHQAPEVKPAPVVKAAEPPSKPAANELPKAAAKPAASGKTYTVVKGDNPYSIAKKMKVSYSALIKTNNIQDPTKLQIGQKLIIP